MMIPRFAYWIVALALFLAGPVLAESVENEWPCVQRQTGALSAGVLWSRSLDAAPALDAEMKDLVAPLALRRVTVEEAGALVEDFAADHPDTEPGQIDALFQAVFHHINRDRDRVLAGIARYAQSQIALSRRIDAAQAELADLTAAKSEDFDRFDALEEQIDWDERIFRERERSLTYVCETPVLLERRAYAVAQMLLPLLGE
jgi:hypothetical protein